MHDSNKFEPATKLQLLWWWIKRKIHEFKIKRACKKAGFKDMTEREQAAFLGVDFVEADDLEKVLTNMVRYEVAKQQYEEIDKERKDKDA